MPCKVCGGISNKHWLFNLVNTYLETSITLIPLNHATHNSHHMLFCMVGSHCLPFGTVDGIAGMRGQTPGPWFNIKMTSYKHRKSHCGHKTILRPSYLHNGISYTGKMTSLYWIRAQVWRPQVQVHSVHGQPTEWPPRSCFNIRTVTWLRYFPYKNETV